MEKKAMIKLRAARVWDLPRLRALWHQAFPFGVSDEYFFEHCFVEDHVESSLVLLEDGMIQSAVYFLPTFWYDAAADTFAPAPCLVGLSTEKQHRHMKYASWLVETACDFMVEKGAGAVWTMLPNDALEIFFSMQGFWTMGRDEGFVISRSLLPEPEGTITRVEPEDYEKMREVLLRGKSHIVTGELVTSLQRDMAERAGGGLFLMEVDGSAVCCIAQCHGDTVRVRELLCPKEKRTKALALLAQEVSGARYTMDMTTPPCGMLRPMNQCNRQLEKPEGYLGCGPLL